MSVIAHFEEINERPERRGAGRRSLRLGVGESTPLIIRDLSLTGMLIESRAPMLVGATFEVDLPDQDAVPAVVVWNSGEFYGCEFHRPISAAALSAAQLQSVPDRQQMPAGSDPVGELRELSKQVDRVAARLDKLIEQLGAR